MKLNTINFNSGLEIKFPKEGNNPYFASYLKTQKTLYEKDC